MIVLHEVTTGGIKVRLIEQHAASFAIVYQGENIYAIAHQTADRRVAHRAYNRAIELATLGLAHPTWQGTDLSTGPTKPRKRRGPRTPKFHQDIDAPPKPPSAA